MDYWSRVILLFFIYAIIGWVWETVYCSLKARRFTYRGFLTGPYCPIYGFGILGVLYLLEPFKDDWLVLYFLSATLVSVLEYFTGYILEKLFHTSWWDYKDIPFNLHGRIALPISAFWGVACVLIVQVIQPWVQILADKLIAQFHWVLPAILTGILLADLIYTIVNMQAFRRITEEINGVLETKAKELYEGMTEKGESLKADWEELKLTMEKELNEKALKQQEFFEELKQNNAVTQRLQRLNFSQRRWIKNYPKLNLSEMDNSETVKRLLASFKEKGKKK